MQGVYSMDILIPDKWLRKFLKTNAKPNDIAKCLSLCGPSVEKINYLGKEPVYSIEITTNRVDSASVYGIAREANAILPTFGIKSRLNRPAPVDSKKLKTKVSYLNVSVDKNLCSRFTAVLIKNIKITPSPNFLQELLKLVGVRPINNVVDISNLIMHELGQPVHTFDYDKIRGQKMILRNSKKGEKVTTLDGKTHTLSGGDIVIEDGSARLIDLAGIMGGENSAVDANTKSVLLFVQTYNPVNIRKTYMSLAHRTEAAVLFEKGLDPELVSQGIKRGIDLFIKIKAGKPVSEILDIYPQPYKARKVDVGFDFINKRLGIALEKSAIIKILRSLDFAVSTTKDTVSIQIPSHRGGDISIPEDIVEEVARIYGYHNLPSKIMEGEIPDPLVDSSFEFENKIKNWLAGWGGIEVYTQSLVASQMVNSKETLKLKNPLGKDGEYLRTSLMPSMISVASANPNSKEGTHLFEITNIYVPRKNDLPKEIMLLAGIFVNTDYRVAKGIVEALLGKLVVKADFILVEEIDFLPSRHTDIKAGNKKIGQFGVLTEGNIYYEFDIEVLRKTASTVKPFKPIPKYPAQIEDITLKLPEKTKIGEVVRAISSIKLVDKVELKDIYKDSYTFRIWYQDLNKTLTDKEVEKIRRNIASSVEKKFGAVTN